MFCINVWLTVKDPDNTGAVAGLLAEATLWTRKEPGCLRFEVYHSEADPKKFLLVERWGLGDDAVKREDVARQEGGRGEGPGQRDACGRWKEEGGKHGG